jgi:predicted 3-demethylubiquinone-9 3-methyltransferase (glyoxalase superfamily)
MSSISTCLWFDKDAEAAARLYTSLVPNSRVERIVPYPADTPSGKQGDTMLVEFTLDGQHYQGLNGGAHYTLTPAASIVALTGSQAETDRLWDALLEGGSPQQCGWLTDRYGLSWQIVPRRLIEIMNEGDADKARRATEAMMRQVKIDIAEIERACAPM